MHTQTYSFDWKLLSRCECLSKWDMCVLDIHMRVMDCRPVHGGFRLLNQSLLG